MATQPEVPNVRIKSGKVRRVLRTVVDTVTLILGVAVAVDVSSDAFDLVKITAPVAAGLLVLRSALTQVVDNPNTPDTV